MLYAFIVAMALVLVVFFMAISLAGVINKNIEAFDLTSLAGTANATMYTSFYGAVGMPMGITVIVGAICILGAVLIYLSYGGVKQ